jgi:hypothetical protein
MDDGAYQDRGRFILEDPTVKAIIDPLLESLMIMAFTVALQLGSLMIATFKNKLMIAADESIFRRNSVSNLRKAWYR